MTGSRPPAEVNPSSSVHFREATLAAAFKDPAQWFLSEAYY